MSDKANLVELRALRDEARAVVRSNLASFSEGLEQRGIGERIKDRAVDEAKEAWSHAVDVASDNKGVVAATLLALIAWFLRGPIGSVFEAFFADDEAGLEPEAAESVEYDEGEQS